MEETLAAFQGRILPGAALPEFASADVLVLEPADHSRDLARALTLSSGRRVHVRSGSHFRTKPSSEEMGGAVILNLTSHQATVATGQTIQMGAPQTLIELATAAASANLSLPIDDTNRFRSVVSYVLAKAPAFPCSSPQPDLLIDYVVSVHAVYIDHPEQQRDMEGDEFRRAVEDGPLSFVVTRLRFKSDGPRNDRWFHCWTTIFEPSTAIDMIKAMDGAEVLEGIDMTLRASSGPFGLNMIIVRVTGLGDDDHRQRVVDFINSVLHGDTIMDQMESRGAQAIADWITLSPVEQVPLQLLTITSVASESPRSLSAIVEPFVKAATFLVGQNPDGTDPTPGIQAWLMIRRSASVANAVDFDSQMFVDDIVASPQQVEEARRLLEIIKDATKSDRSLFARISGAISHAIKPSPKTFLEARPAGAGTIPNLKGDLFLPGTLSYAAKAFQYATASYDAATIAKRMSPMMIVVPRDEPDVVTVVEYAAAHSFHVVVRSGGHQYCGMSSGGSDTIQLSMELFNSISITDGIVTFGAGVPLFLLNSALKSADLALPHGVCPLVAAGGHVQTGGVGQTLRTLGLLMDYVVAFTMVTVDSDKKASVKRYERPQPGAQDDIFSAVLGGGPGSWGVILTYEVEAVQNVPGIVGYWYYYLYNKKRFDSRKAFTIAMYKCQEWNQRQVEGRLPDGQDLFVSFLSGQFLRPPLIIVEATATTPEGAQEIRQVVDDIGAIQSPIPVLGKRVDGDTTLSALSHFGVHSLFIEMPGGREFFRPFKKTMHCSKKAFDKEFIDRFVDLVVRGHNDPDTAVVAQAFVCGGKLAKPRQTCNRMQRRDCTFMLVFDVFYTPNSPDAEKKAISLQNEMKGLFLSSYTDKEERMFWASFQYADRGEQDVDMSDPVTQVYYYNSPEEYRSLQEIKKIVDPLNIFHTKFTVQP